MATFSPETRSGTVLLDDGTELPFGSEIFDASGLRFLRFGQRVNIRATSDRVTALAHATFPLE